MSIQIHNKIRELFAEIEKVRAELAVTQRSLEDRMDRIEFRKKPGPKPRRTQEKMND